MNTFALDILDGLRQTPKRLSSKYFYDETGDRLFQQIMQLPEYYLTRCETEIFETHKESLRQAFGNTPFDLIELGAGDGMKTKILLRYFLAHRADFRFMPVDISGNVLSQLTIALERDLPQLEVLPQQGDYYERLASLPVEPGRRKVVLFLGSNIGNFTLPEAALLLRRVAGQLSAGDLMLTGFDLKKDPAVILSAYNDSSGVTREFNLNLLRRINRELGADFQPDGFLHWAQYNPLNGACKSYLVSKRDQEVELLGNTIDFRAWEAIDMELSQKYDLLMIENLALEAGFCIVRHYLDTRNYFADSLWKKA